MIKMTRLNRIIPRLFAFNEAAQNGHLNAQYWLGDYYLAGKGCEKNKQLGFQWISKSAAQHLPEAQFGLGECYLNGTGVEKDEQEAVRWFNLAADQGNEEAIAILAVWQHRITKANN